MPSLLNGTNPLDIAEVAKKAGWTVQPLKKGSKKDLAYSEGGGFSMNPPAGSGESLYIQYHPGGVIMGRVLIIRYHLLKMVLFELI